MLAWRRWLGFGGLLLIASAWVFGQPRPTHVIVLANASEPQSVSLARHYMEARGIPEENLIALPLPSEETLSWESFIERLYNPLLEVLVARGWLQGDASKQEDAIGRHHYALYGNDIDFLVLCKGVPLRIANDPTRLPEKRPPGLQEAFWINQASVDSELALLPSAQTPVVAYVPNPLFNVAEPGPFTRQQVVRVARLDAARFEEARALVDHAIEGERIGLSGRAYIDYAHKYPEGDHWLERSGRMLEKLGFDTSYDDDAALISWGSRFDAPAWYLGWWAWNPEGVLSDPELRFPPGAVGIHIHSFSAQTLRRADKGWVAPLVARGITATVGNVYEPYLKLTHYPHLFVDGIRRGQSVGEAAYYALPVLSWQSIFVGDPLYQPKFNLDTQLAAIDKGGYDPHAQYVVLRKMNLLIEEGKREEALAFGRARRHKAPGLALAYALAQQEWKAGYREAALEALDLVRAQPSFAPEEQGLAAEIARWLSVQKVSKDALEIYVNLLEHSRLCEPFEQAILPEAIRAAESLGQTDRVAQWQARIPMPTE